MNNDFSRMNRLESASTMKHYLLSEQGYDEDVVRNMSYSELKECYESYRD